MPCKDWLGLNNYKPESFKIKNCLAKPAIRCHAECQQAGTKIDQKVHSTQ